MKLNKKCLNAYNKAVKAEITVKGIRKAISDYNYYNTFNGITNVYRQGYIVCNFDTLTVRFTKEIENEQLESTLEDNEIVIIDAKSYIGMAMNTAIKIRVYEMIAKEIEAEKKEAVKELNTRLEAEKKEAVKELNTRLEAEKKEAVKELNTRLEAEKAEYKKIYSPFYTHTYLMTINEYKIKVGEYLVLCGVGFFHTFSPTTIQVAKTAGYKRIYRVMTVNENEGKITVEHIETKEKYYFYFGYFVEHHEVKVSNTKKYSYAYNKAENKEVKAMIAYNFYNYLVNVLNYDSENWEKLSKIIAIHLDNEAVEAVIYFDEHNNFWRMKRDRDLKINYHINNNNDLENLDNKIVTTTLKNSALYDYLINEDTKNCFTNTELYQQIKLCENEAKKISDNIPSKNTNIYSYSFITYLASKKTYSNIMIAMSNKDLQYSFNKLLVLRQTIHKTLNRISNRALYNKYLFYYHCLNCIASVYDSYETEQSFKELKSVLYKAIA